MKGFGISVNPPKHNLKNLNKFDISTVLYDVYSCKVYGGSNPNRTVAKVAGDGVYHPGGDFKFELDLSNRSFIMEINGKRFIIDDNLGDFEYSPFVNMFTYAPEVTLL